MEDDRMVKKLTNWKPFGKRPAGRPKNRWIDGILKDMEVLKVKNWKELIGNRKEWNNLVEKAKTHPGFSAAEEEELQFIFQHIQEKAYNVTLMHVYGTIVFTEKQ
jgi:hypothetical protein